MKRKILFSLAIFALILPCAVILGACKKDDKNSSNEPVLSHITYLDANQQDAGFYQYEYSDDLEVYDIKSGYLKITYNDNSTKNVKIADIPAGDIAYSYTYTDSNYTTSDSISGLPTNYSAGSYYISISYKGQFAYIDISISKATYGNPYAFTLTSNEWNYANMPTDLLDSLTIYKNSDKLDEVEIDLANKYLYLIDKEDWESLKTTYDTNNLYGQYELPNTADVQTSIESVLLYYDGSTKIDAGEYVSIIEFEDNNYRLQYNTIGNPITINKSTISVVNPDDEAKIWGTATFDYEYAEQLVSGIPAQSVSGYYKTDDSSLDLLLIKIDNQPSMTFTEAKENLHLSFLSFENKNVKYTDTEIKCLYNIDESNYDSLELKYTVNVNECEFDSTSLLNLESYSVAQYNSDIESEDYADFSFRLSNNSGILFTDIVNVTIKEKDTNQEVEGAELKSIKVDAFGYRYYVYIPNAQVKATTYTIAYSLKEGIDTNSVVVTSSLDGITFPFTNGSGSFDFVINKVNYYLEEVENQYPITAIADIDGKISVSYYLYYNSLKHGDTSYLQEQDKDTLENISIGYLTKTYDSQLSDYSLSNITHTWSTDTKGSILTISANMEFQDNDYMYNDIKFTLSATSTNTDFANIDSITDTNLAELLRVEANKYELEETDYVTANNGTKVYLAPEKITHNLTIGEVFKLGDYFDLESFVVKNGDTVLGNWKLLVNDVEYDFTNETGYSFTEEGTYIYRLEMVFTPEVSYVNNYTLWDVSNFKLEFIVSAS